MILEREADIELAGEAASGADALQMACRGAPEVIVVDLQISHPSGIETARALRETCPEAKIVLVSLLVGEEYAEEALRAGAYGFVASDSAQNDLALAIRLAFAGKTFISPQIPRLAGSHAGNHTE